MEGNHKDSTQSVYRTFNTGSIDWRNAGLAQFAVNALVIANHSTWNDEFHGLLEQVHQLHLIVRSRTSYVLNLAGLSVILLSGSQ